MAENSIRTNAGYTITDSVHIGETEFVIGHKVGAFAPYVTWECKGGDNYFWGHYLLSRRDAERDFLERACSYSGYLSRFERRHIDEEDAV